MRYVYLEKGDMGKFIELIRRTHKVVAPVKKENAYVFSEIETSDQVCMDYIPTILPHKKYLLPPREKLGGFTMGKVKMDETSVKVEPTVIFAAHTCDIDGIGCLEVVLYREPADPYYKRRGKFMVIIGYECLKPCDDYATCVTMDNHNPKSGYDIMITDAGDKYILHINSNAGDEIVGDNSLFRKADEKQLKATLRKLREEKKSRFDAKLKPQFKELAPLLERSYKSPVWEDVGKRCVSCGNCTAVCPTCYCFDIFDEVKLDLTGGERKRIWDSCQLEEFAMVAGGESFREERLSRQRHRYYRKFNYPVKKYHRYFCTGCGRCSRSCVADISLIETLNDLKKESENV